MKKEKFIGWCVKCPEYCDEQFEEIIEYINETTGKNYGGDNSDYHYGIDNEANGRYTENICLYNWKEYSISDVWEIIFGDAEIPNKINLVQQQKPLI